MERIVNKNIWLSVCRGDRKSFETLFYFYAPKLVQFGLKFTPKTELIEDAIQELFIQIFKNKDGISDEINIQIYLFKALRNNLLRLIEKEKRYAHPNNQEDYFDVVFSTEKKIEVNEELQLKKKQLTERINELSARQKEIIYLRYTRGFDYEEISQILNMSVEASRNLFWRALKTLRNEQYIFHSHSIKNSM